MPSACTNVIVCIYSITPPPPEIQTYSGYISSIQSNGLTERFNQTLCRSLAKLANENQDNWDESLDTVLLAYRVSKCKSTGYTPFYMMYHRQARLPIDLEVMPTSDEEEPGEEAPGVEEFLAAKLLARENLKEDAMENIRKAQKKDKEYYDRKHCLKVKMNYL